MDMEMHEGMGEEQAAAPEGGDKQARILELVEKIAAALAKAGLPGMSDEDLQGSAEDFMMASGEMEMPAPPKKKGMMNG